MRKAAQLFAVAIFFGALALPTPASTQGEPTFQPITINLESTYRYETVADPMPTCIAPGAEPKYEPMSFHDFFITYMDGNYIYRTAEMDEE